MVSGSYEYMPDVDMSGYVPLDGRVVGACRCENCSSNSAIRRWHDNDLVCRFSVDGDLCDRHGKCYEKRRVYIGRFKGKPRFRLVVTKCPCCLDGVKF